MRDMVVDSQTAPTLDDRIVGRQGLGLVQLFEGHGKGKTTAAIGSMVRMVGAGKRAAIVYFDKGGNHYMERTVFDRLGVDWFAFGRDRIDAKTGRFDFSVTEEDRVLGYRAIERAHQLFASDAYDLVVLDEVNSSCALGFVDEAAVLALIDRKPDNLELILTGRDAPTSFKDRAHLVTEMRLVKHYFYSGVKAREGIDY